MSHTRKIDDKLLMSMHAAGSTGKDLSVFFDCSQAAISKRISRLTPGPPKAIDALTPQRAAVVKRIVEGESPTNAVEACYDTTTRASAREISSRILSIPSVQKAIQEELDRVGLSRRTRVSKLAEFVESPDASIGLKALKMAHQMGDDFPAVTTKNINVNLDACPVDLSFYQMDTEDCDAWRRERDADQAIETTAVTGGAGGYSPFNPD